MLTYADTLQVIRLVDTSQGQTCLEVAGWFCTWHRQNLLISHVYGIHGCMNRWKIVQLRNFLLQVTVQ